MQNNYDWLTEIQPLHLEEDAARTKRIQAQVMQQLPHMAEREKNMKSKKPVHRCIRPLILAAAILGIGAASLVTANAATDGALFSKMTVYINGKETEADVRMVEQNEDSATYEVIIDDGNSDNETRVDMFVVNENEDGVDVQLEGDNPNGDSNVELEIEIDTTDLEETTESTDE